MQKPKNKLARWISDGTPWIWLNAAAVSACILLVVGLLLLIAVRGMGHFWPAPVEEIIYQNTAGDTVKLAGQIIETETITAARLRESGVEVAEGTEWVTRLLLKTGN